MERERLMVWICKTVLGGCPNWWQMVADGVWADVPRNSVAIDASDDGTEMSDRLRNSTRWPFDSNCEM